jgi:hypothetical protein
MTGQKKKGILLGKASKQAVCVNGSETRIMNLCLLACMSCCIGRTLRFALLLFLNEEAKHQIGDAEHRRF